MAKGWRVSGPGDVWSIWDHGDEMTVCEGPDMLGRVAARVPVELARRLTPEEKWEHVKDAAGAIHVAKLLGSTSPVFRKLWRN